MPPRQPQALYRLYASTRVPGAGGWDLPATDPAGERLHVAHGNQLDVLDAKTRKLLGTAPGTPAATATA